ncbi:YciI family protein [Sciscionella sediminilitoris]|uniref:YciI family protein n=1 Tax=Sciscionella sediminilitoris TaxID=1445613 RepID=UPI001E2C63FB|nr:YciI family protein [Sciscionella sp. SE31]
MRFMVIRKADEETETGVQPEQELYEAMEEFNRKTPEGVRFLGGDGLHPSARGARVEFDGGKPRVLDGPFAETKELIAGYSLIEAPSLAAAIEWVKGWPELDAHGAARLEIRRIYEFEELGLTALEG